MRHRRLDRVIPRTGMDRLEPEGALEQCDQPVAGCQRLISWRQMLGTGLVVFPSAFQRHHLLFTCTRPAAEDPCGDHCTAYLLPSAWAIFGGGSCAVWQDDMARSRSSICA